MTEHCAHHENNTIRIATVEKGLEGAEGDVKALFEYKEEHGRQLEQVRSDVQAMKLIMETGFREQTKQICDVKTAIGKMIAERIAVGDSLAQKIDADWSRLTKWGKIKNVLKEVITGKY